jgi:hypothetical protein
MPHMTTALTLDAATPKPKDIQRKREENKDTVRIKTKKNFRKSEEGSDYRDEDKQPGRKQKR